MKKITIGLFVLLVIAISSIYFFIPSNLLVSSVTPIYSNNTSTTDFSTNDSLWKQWWPGNLENVQGKVVGTFKDVRYEIANKSYNNTTILLIKDNDTTKANLAIAGFNHDAIKLICQFTDRCSFNPITRIKQYKKAAYLKQNINEVMNHLKIFLEKPENIYGFKIKSTIVKDTILMSTKAMFNHIPSTQEVYSLVKLLRNHIQQNTGIETNAPMLNITKETDGQYKTMVAIPVNRILPTTDKIVLKTMVIGRILESDNIVGGPSTINHAFSMFEKYFLDFKHSSPAIPFQSLITDRDTQTDTAKWVTKFYYPIF